MSTFELCVIRAAAEHADALGAVHAAAFQAAYQGLMPQTVLARYTPEARAAVFAEALRTRREEYYLFCEEQTPVGLAIVFNSHEPGAPKSWGEIYAFYTTPDVWGTPLTHQAFSFCLDRLKRLGFHTAKLWVLEDNERAVRFYQKHGFAPDGAAKLLTLRVGLSEIRMSRTL